METRFGDRSPTNVISTKTLRAARLATGMSATRSGPVCPHPHVDVAVLVFVFASVLVLMIPSPWLRADDPMLQQRRRQQQATVELARQLIADVLDIQIEQFSENGLDTLPVFADIQQMRASIDHVTDQDMQQIIKLLNEAQRATGQSQTEFVSQARSKARQVVTVLMAERERLRQRMKVAHAQAQLQQLIDQQESVRKKTERIYTTPSSERDRVNLAALEDQRDAHTLFDQLTESFETIRQFGSKESQAAEESIQQMQEEGVEPMFDAAESALAKSDIDRAQQSQTDIIKQLSSVLDKIAAAQGLQPRDPASALAKVQELMQQQQQLADDTRNGTPGDQLVFDQLSQRQKGINDQLGELDPAAAASEGGDDLVEQAKNAAAQAEEELFQGNRDTALKQQHEVMRNLSQLEELLKAAEAAPSDDQELAALTSQVDQLEQLGANLDELAKQQDQVMADVAADPQAGQQQQQQVAEGLADQAESAPEAAGVQKSVQDAAQQAQQAAKTMQDSSAEASGARAEAAAGVKKAIEAAQAQTAAQLQAAREARQGANDRSQANSKPGQGGKPSANSAQQKSQSVTSESRRGTPSRAADSQQTSPQTAASRRTVADAKRADQNRALLTGRAYTETPWFARLPAELREAIRMRGRRQPPRGYEERLRRYFESVDK